MTACLGMLGLFLLVEAALAQDAVPRARYDSLMLVNDSLTALVETARLEAMTFGRLWVGDLSRKPAAERHWAAGTLVASTFDSYGVILSRDLPAKFRLPLRASIALVHDNETDDNQVLFGLLAVF